MTSVRFYSQLICWIIQYTHTHCKIAMYRSMWFGEIWPSSCYTCTPNIIFTDHILLSFLQWLEHKCDVVGCSEGYMSIDGNEKLRKPQCTYSSQKHHKIGKEYACRNLPMPQHPNPWWQASKGLRLLQGSCSPRYMYNLQYIILTITAFTFKLNFISY